MPQVQVAISIKTRFHQNPAHVWNANHVTDIDAMSVAYAYCEAVFTDNEAPNALRSSPELRTLETFVPRRPQELIEWLDSLPSMARGPLPLLAASLAWRHCCLVRWRSLTAALLGGAAAGLVFLTTTYC